MKTKQDNLIWTITVIYVGQQPWGLDSEPRTWGYGVSREDAISMLHSLDDEAGFYTHGVIESFPPGIGRLAKSEEWFKYSGKNKQGKNIWELCEKPKCEYHGCNYGIG